MQQSAGRGSAKGVLQDAQDLPTDPGRRRRRGRGDGGRGGRLSRDPYTLASCDPERPPPVAPPAQAGRGGGLGLRHDSRG